jgi:hypothetical protein
MSEPANVPIAPTDDTPGVVRLDCRRCGRDIAARVQGASVRVRCAECGATTHACSINSGSGCSWRVGPDRDGLVRFDGGDSDA